MYRRRRISSIVRSLGPRGSISAIHNAPVSALTSLELFATHLQSLDHGELTFCSRHRRQAVTARLGILHRLGRNISQDEIEDAVRKAVSHEWTPQVTTREVLRVVGVCVADRHQPGYSGVGRAEDTVPTDVRPLRQE